MCCITSSYGVWIKNPQLAAHKIICRLKHHTKETFSSLPSAWWCGWSQWCSDLLWKLHHLQELWWPARHPLPHPKTQGKDCVQWHHPPMLRPWGEATSAGTSRCILGMETFIWVRANRKLKYNKNIKYLYYFYNILHIFLTNFCIVLKQGMIVVVQSLSCLLVRWGVYEQP